MGLSTRVSWAYAGGGIIRTVMMMSIMVYWNAFLLEVAHVDAHKVGIMIFFIKVMDACNDPVIGYLSDNAVYPGRKRRAQMSVALGPMCILFVGMWATPEWSESLLTVYYTVMAMLFDVFMSVYDINYDLLVSEMTVTYTDRVPLVFRKNLVGTLAIMLSTTLQASYVASRENARGYASFAGYILLSGVPFAILCIVQCRERRGDVSIWSEMSRYHAVDVNSDRVGEPDSADQPVQFVDLQPTAAQSLRYFVRRMAADYASILRDREYICLSVTNMAVNVMLSVMVMFLKTYIEYAVDAGPDEFTYTLLRVQIGLVVGLVLYAALFYFGAVKDKRLTLLGTLWLLLGSALIFSIKPRVVSIQVCFGMWISGATVVVQAMLPDVIDVGQSMHATQSRRAGSHYGLFSVMHKLATAVAISLCDVGLGALGFSGNGVASSESVQYLRALYAIVPPIFIAMAIVSAYMYGITPERQQEAVQQIADKIMLTGDSDDEIFMDIAKSAEIGHPDEKAEPVSAGEGNKAIDV